MRKKILPAVLLFAVGVSVFALDFSFRPGGFVFIPAGAGNEAADGNERFDTGGGGELGFDIDFASVWPNPLGLGYTAGIEGGFLYSPYKPPAEGNAQTWFFGGALGLSYFPLSRLFTRLDGGIGVYQGVVEQGRGNTAFWWRAGGEAGFRFTPLFTLAARGGWRQYQNSKGGAFNSGLYAGLGLHITFETGRNINSGGAAAAFSQDDGVYPVFLSLYQENPAGTITIRNNENAEIRDLRVSFRAAGYTASEFSCGPLPLIAKGRSAELPLYADFSPELLRFTDTGRVLGEVIIRYRFLGAEKQAVQTVAVQVHNRNVFPPLDPAGLAAFVSPASPEILEYAKHITGLARSSRWTGLNQNMLRAVWLFEGLRAAGIRLDGAYTENGEAQFPAETLGFRTGNRMDLGLLYAAALEAAGIASALIPLENDFIAACRLGVNQAEAALLFNGLEKVLVIDGELWMPLSMSAFNGGFMAAWDGAVEALNGVFSNGAELDFVMTENAWSLYPPAPLPVQAAPVVQVNGGILTQTTDRVIQQYINREIQPLTQSLQRQIAASPSAALYNRLGILFARSGRAADARGAYERAAGMGLVPAMINRGNLAFIEKDYAAAERWFRQALAREPANQAALRSLERLGERRDER
jgi:tetratricopeptide (TPR) repeat protein